MVYSVALDNRYFFLVNPGQGVSLNSRASGPPASSAGFTSGTVPRFFRPEGPLRAFFTFRQPPPGAAQARSERSNEGGTKDEGTGKEGAGLGLGWCTGSGPLLSRYSTPGVATRSGRCATARSQRLRIYAERNT